VLVKRILVTGVCGQIGSELILALQEEEIRFQICAEHTKYDVDYVLKVLGEYKGGH